MKKGCIEIQFDEEKLVALKHYLSRKELVLENEAQTMINEMYEKIVPSEVRSYIEKRPIPEVKQRRKKTNNVEEVVD